MTSNPYLGDIMLFAGNFAPRGWAFCDGQLLQISGNQALFSLLSTMYGGDGRNNFRLPDLRGRVPIGAGTGPSLPPVRQGQQVGVHQQALADSQLPSHTHQLQPGCDDINSDSNLPAGNVPGADASGLPTGQYATSSDGSKMIKSTSTKTGGGQAINNVQPILGLHYCIALVGLFPPRN